MTWRLRRSMTWRLRRSMTWRLRRSMTWRLRRSMTWRLRRGGSGRRDQAPRLLERDREVAAQPGQDEPLHAEDDLQVPAPASGHRLGSVGGELEVALGVGQRSLVQLAGGQQRGQLGIGGNHVLGKAAQQV